MQSLREVNFLYWYQLLTFSFDREDKTIDEETSQTLQGPPLPKEASNLPSELQDKQNQTVRHNPSQITGFIETPSSTVFFSL